MKVVRTCPPLTLSSATTVPLGASVLPQSQATGPRSFEPKRKSTSGRGRKVCEWHMDSTGMVFNVGKAGIKPSPYPCFLWNINNFSARAVASPGFAGEDKRSPGIDEITSVRKLWLATRFSLHKAERNKAEMPV